MQDEARPAPRGRVAHARAALVAVHLGALSLLGIPEPEVDPGELDDPEVQAWFDHATAQLQGWGLPVTRDQVFTHGVAWGQGYLAVRRTILTPVHTYANLAGTHQSWRMFSDVPQHSAVLFIEAKIDGEWRPIHRTRYAEPPDAVWRPAWWDQERIRSLINVFVKKKGRSDWERLRRLLGSWLPADFPEATAFRMGMQSVRFPPPDELMATGDLVWEKRFWVTEIPIGTGAP